MAEEREKVECPNCGGYYTVKADGEIRSHNCPGVITVGSDGIPADEPAKKTSRVPKLKAPKSAPKNVRSLGIAGIASGVENLTSIAIASSVPMERKDIPDAVIELPDADAMIGPFLDLLWPNLPKGVQKVVSAISDRSDLIAAFLAWSQWVGTIKAFTDEAKLNRPSTIIEGSTNVQPIRTAPNGFEGPIGYEPFNPVTPSSEAL